MFGSGTLDTVIGLIFVFLLVSMLVTIINEMIAAALMSRAKWLRRGIDRLVGADWMARVYAHPLVEGTARKQKTWLFERGPSYIPSRSFANVLMSLIQGDAVEISECRSSLRQALSGASSPGDTLVDLKARLSALAVEMQNKGGISAVVTADVIRQLDANISLHTRIWSSERYTVADAYADIQSFIDAMPARYVRQTLESMPPGQLRETLLTLFDDAKNDVEKLKQNIEVWFNSGMDRVNGWYKRRSQLVISILALLVAIAMNVDAINIFRHLQAYPAAAAAVANHATRFTEQNPVATGGATSVAAGPQPGLNEQMEAVRKQLKELAIPIGWVPRPGTAAQDANGQVLPQLDDWCAMGKLFAQHAFGWLLTALAATLGAPFWFDMLNRVISIRAAGKPPEEQPKPPKAVSVPVEPGQSQQEADRLGQGDLRR